MSRPPRPTAPSGATESAIPKRSYRLTDIGNAERLVDQHGESIRFCRNEHCWYAWDGVRWAQDEGVIMQLAKKTVRSMLFERARLLSSEPEYEDEHINRAVSLLTSWQTRSERATNLSAMIRLAQSDPSVSVSSRVFDSNTFQLNVHNGTIDLRTGFLNGHTPDDLITRLASAAFDAAALCPRWKRFLGEVFAPHPDAILFLQRAIGYSLTGETSEDCIFILDGAGRNGKSTLMGVLQALLGSYAGVAEIDALLEGHRTGPQEDIADMRGRRVVTALEPRAGARFATATMKWLSGGDRLRARRLYQHAEEFTPTHKLWLSVNHFPWAEPGDAAFWRRIQVIPFDISFSGREDRTLRSGLLQELPGILQWSVQGCLRWQHGGLNASPSVSQATEHRRDGGGRH